MTEERWKAIPGYEGSYEVSDLGRVRSLDRVVQCSNRIYRLRGRTLRQCRRKDGYLSVGLTRGTELVHRLVLLAFVGECPKGMECRHLNGDPGDNCLANLSWGTKVENAADRDAHGRQVRGRSVEGVRLTEDDVRDVVVRLERGETQPDISRDLGVSRGAIAGIAQGVNWKHVTGGAVNYQPKSRKLNGPAAVEILRRARRGDRVRDIARAFGVAKNTVRDITTGRTWSRVTGVKPKRQSA